jgi:hypothetical protein
MKKKKKTPQQRERQEPKVKLKALQKRLQAFHELLPDKSMKT